jgi:3-oxoacyl-[acyl-carrier-protein] synthase II
MTDPREPIAIVGMGLRFPGAADPGAFWRLLAEGRDEIREAPEERWQGDGARPKGGYLKSVDGFDWRAFRVSPREARRMDPQHRLLLETAWNALEDAGIPLAELPKIRTAVFTGLNFNDYQSVLRRDRSQIDGYTLLGNVPAMAANRISFCFGLTGPSIALNAACSSSLAAVHYACQSLHAGEADLALAGGVELMLAPESSLMLGGAGVLSASGNCCAMDLGADGYLRGEGAAVLVLCRLSAVRPGDRVYALLRGSALNHNGRNEWLMAASTEAQEDAIRTACGRAGVDPAAIEYVELHGSALPKGDRAEARAVGSALCGDRRGRPCRVGTVTNNIGYLGAAGGMAGLAKVALSLYHGQLPPTIHVEKPHPEFQTERWNLHPQTALEAWPQRPGPALAGVLSTSLGGANAFAILEGAPARARVSRRTDRYVLLLSAHSEPALRQRAGEFRAFLTQASEAALYNICYTASARRSQSPHLAVFAGRSLHELIERLKDWLEGKPAPVPESSGDLYPDGECVSLPAYPFQRERLWPEWLTEEPPTPQSLPRSRPRGSFPQELRAADPTLRPEMVFGRIHGIVLELLGIDRSEALARDRRLLDLGLNSLVIAQLAGRLDAELAVAIPVATFFQCSTLEALANHVVARLFPQQPPAPDAELIEWIGRLSEAEAEALLLEKIATLEEVDQ